MLIVKDKKQQRAWLKHIAGLKEKEIKREPTMRQLMARIESVEDLLIHVIAKLKENDII